MGTRRYSVVVIGGGHAGVEAAWAAANALAGLEAEGRGRVGAARVALVTLDPSKIGVMSCNPANGGLAKGQLVREIDAMGGLMGLATDATGIQFKMLNTSKGPAVWGPRAQCDKHAYAEAVQAMLASRAEIEVVGGAVDDLIVEDAGGGGGAADGDGAWDAPRRVVGVFVSAAPEARGWTPREMMRHRRVVETERIEADAVVLTTGTFMRALMHTGETRTEGGRHGEASAVGIAASLRRLGFELGRLKTGTPPRVRRGSVDWDGLERQWGDERAVAFSDLSAGVGAHGRNSLKVDRTELASEPANSVARSDAAAQDGTSAFASLERFPVLEQVACRVTSTTRAGHDLIRANLHRAPMFSGQIESVGPRYCPSIEDKVVRFAGRDGHTVFLEPESLRDDWVYCNGIATSLPSDVQDAVVRSMAGCERAEIVRYGYAVEYDMVRPHQIRATGMAKSIAGLFLAGQINGTSGYEEAAAQGLVAGVNAARFVLREESGLGAWVPSRSESYLGVLMDDLVTKTPVEPYRMFTSRAEHRLLLRADNAADRLTPIAKELGLLSGHWLGERRWRVFERRRAQLRAGEAAIEAGRVGGEALAKVVKRPGFGVEDLGKAIGGAMGASDGVAARDGDALDRGVLVTLLAERQYEGFVGRQRAEIKRQAELERRRLPAAMVFGSVPGLRGEARAALERYRPETFGQAGRLEGITPADLTILAVYAKRVGAGARF
ncbi:MAG: FAD-dependent oxidoreductase [Phycisphaerales bacterium]